MYEMHYTEEIILYNYEKSEYVRKDQTYQYKRALQVLILQFGGID